jgi:hypothetical protein
VDVVVTREGERPLPAGRVFWGPPGTPLYDMVEPGSGTMPRTPGDDLRIMSPYAVLNRAVRVPEEVAGPPGKVWSVWAVHRQPGMVWVADGTIAHPVAVTDLDIVVTSPHLCFNDELCCDTCNTHLGCRCPELVEP